MACCSGMILTLARFILISKQLYFQNSLFWPLS